MVLGAWVLVVEVVKILKKRRLIEVRRAWRAGERGVQEPHQRPGGCVRNGRAPPGKRPKIQI